MENKSKILSLDPSSAVVGYAVMTPGRELIQAGAITPARKSAGSFERIASMENDVLSVLVKEQPHTILIEWTKGKVGKRHHGLGAGLAVYGCGVGWIGCLCQQWVNRKNVRCQLIPILENEWTRGVPKKDRQLAVAQIYPQYDPADDPGADVADAIGMADWWLRELLIYE